MDQFFPHLERPDEAQRHVLVSLDQFCIIIKCYMLRVRSEYISHPNIGHGIFASLVIDKDPCLNRMKIPFLSFDVS